MNIRKLMRAREDKRPYVPHVQNIAPHMAQVNTTVRTAMPTNMWFDAHR